MTVLNEEYLGTNNTGTITKPVLSIAELRLKPGNVQNTAVSVLINGAVSYWIWDSNSVIADDNATVVKANALAIGRWVKIIFDLSGNPTHFKGLFTNLAALNAAYPIASVGDYAQVDTGNNDIVQTYVYDVQDGWVVLISSGNQAHNTDQLPEGSTNLYFTAARAIAALTNTLSNYMTNVTSIAGFSFNSNSVSGHLALPTWLGGLIIQWGGTTGGYNNWTAFSMPFPNKCFQVIVTEANALGWGGAPSPVPTTHGASSITNDGYYAFATFDYQNGTHLYGAAAQSYIAIGH